MIENIIEFTRDIMKSHLTSYEKAVDMTIKNNVITDWQGRLNPSIPIEYKYEIPYMLDFLKFHGIDVFEFQNRYNKATELLRLFEFEKGKEFIDALYNEVNFLTEIYPGSIFQFIPEETVEVDLKMEHRNDFEFLLIEASKFCDITDLKLKIHSVDKVNRCMFRRNLNILMQYYPLMNLPYYPDNFWWRHIASLGDPDLMRDAAYEHYEKHALCYQEWGSSNKNRKRIAKDEYGSKAAYLLNNKNMYEVYYHLNGNIVVYDHVNNEWAEGNNKGEIENFFRPDNTKGSFIQECIDEGILIGLIGKSPSTLKGIDLMLKEYEESVNYIINNFNNIETSEYRIYTPLVRKYLLSLNLSSGKEESEAIKKFSQISDRFYSGISKNKDYYSKLVDELNYYVDTFPGLVCYFFDLEPFDEEVKNDLNRRDVLEILITELEKDHSLKVQKQQVEIIDRVLYHKFWVTIRWEEKTWEQLKSLRGVDKPNYPDRFWWRHLSKIESDVQSKNSDR